MMDKPIAKNQRWKLLTLALSMTIGASIGTAEQQVSDLLGAWDFDSYRNGVITSEMISPADAAWDTFSRVPSPSATDYADASQGHGVSIVSLTPLHRGSAPASVLNNGQAQDKEIDVEQSVYFPNDSKDSRILVDLKSLQSVYQVNTYSWHRYHRKNQQHELFYTVSDAPSDPKAVPLGSDWVSLGSVSTDYPEEPRGKVGVSFADTKGVMIAQARQLLLVVNAPQCFYGEIDVVTDAATAQRSVFGGGTDLAAQVKEVRQPPVRIGADSMHGNLEKVPGVRGNALKFDGFGTKVVRPAAQVEPLGKAFTIEAWIAPQEFSLNQTAIIEQAKDKQTGYFFGIDNQGRVLFQANIGGQWHACHSGKRLPILRWSHVAVTFDSEQGIRLYIDGQPEGKNLAKGELTPAKDTDLWIGMSHAKQPPIPQSWTAPELLNWMVFDGLIDELKIHSKALSADELHLNFTAVTLAEPQPLQYRKLPSGPKDGKQFGAFYTRLKYSPEWEQQQRVADRADVVVTFEDARANFVFWRGTSYIPHWVTDNDIWYNNQFVERRGNSDGCIGCVEPMSDKKCRFSNVRVIHSSPARTVIHWRYAPVGLKLKHPYQDPYSGLGDWVDETYTIYPDMVGVRSMTLHSTAIDEFTDWQEAIIVHAPGRLPEDNIEATAVSIGNLQGQVSDYTWPDVAVKGGVFPGLPQLSCIQVINLKSELRPFMIVPPTPGVRIKKFGGTEPHSIFHHWNHWPVAHGMSHTTPAFDASKPSHSSLSVWKNWELYRSTDNSKTHLMLHGMTNKGCQDLVGLAKSWVSPVEASIASGNYQSVGFDQEQKAYVVERIDSSQAGTLHLNLDASEESPLVNPAMVVKNWPAGAMAQVEVNGKTLKAEELKLGLEQELEGPNLVVWLRLESVELLDVRITPSSLTLGNE